MPLATPWLPLQPFDVSDSSDTPQVNLTVIRRVAVVSARGLLHVALLLYCPSVQVIELGQVGALQPSQPSSAALKLYAHAQKGAGYGDPADILTALSAAAQGEAAAAQVSSRIPCIYLSSFMFSFCLFTYLLCLFICLCYDLICYLCIPTHTHKCMQSAVLLSLLLGSGHAGRCQRLHLCLICLMAPFVQRSKAANRWLLHCKE